jgi:uncharacterized protein DUF6885
MVETLEAQQKDNLCGPFWAARVLREAGFTEWDEDEIALRAGTVLPDPDEGSVPPGAESRTGYRFELPRAAPAAAGTAAGALAAAIEAASGGALHCAPLRGAWDAATVEALLGLGGVRLLANVRTGLFWGSHPEPELLLAELRGMEVEGPPADWDVGHFCELELLVRGPGGSLVVVHDSYPEFGVGGRHFQPPRIVAAALARGDGREGGVLAVGPETAETERLARTLGLDVRIWDNGTRR